MRLALAFVALLAAASAAAQDNNPPVSRCLAIAQLVPGATYADLTPYSVTPARRVSAHSETVEITYAGHSTSLIQTPAGVRIATDFSGVHGTAFQPQVVTMNRAHPIHFTFDPLPGVDYVLHGWGDNERPVHHALQVDDVLLYNVTTHIPTWDGGHARDENSIFIFEVADLCIGRLGHLHTKLSNHQFGKIGRLDIVMAPIDGGLTQSVTSMSEIVTRLYASIVLPMHRHSTLIGAFTSLMGE